jgi:hypothetical protein
MFLVLSASPAGNLMCVVSSGLWGGQNYRSYLLIAHYHRGTLPGLARRCIAPSTLAGVWRRCLSTLRGCIGPGPMGSPWPSTWSAWLSRRGVPLSLRQVADVRSFVR